MTRVAPPVTGPPTGHLPTLIAAFAHFDVCFMLWGLIGALGTFVFEGTRSDAALKGLIIGLPILVGSVLRVPLGIVSDRIGGRRIGLGLLAFLVVPLLIGWSSSGSIATLLLIGATLGTAGASFAIVLPLASRWYPPERQGLVMGIAAAGNSGTVVANLLAPRLAHAFGWHAVFGLALLPLAIVFGLFWLLSKDAPFQRAMPAASYSAVLLHPDTRWLCAFYAVTFGGYVGLGSFLPVFLRDQFHLSPVAAGTVTAVAAFSGSLSRPIGGYLADRFGGVPALERLLFAIAISYFAVGALPTLPVTVTLIMVTMVGLGLGNGAIFQLVPQRFNRQVGAVTGIVGAVGGIGGFLLPTLLGVVKQVSSSYGPAFMVLAGAAAAAAVSLRRLQHPSRQGAWRSGTLAIAEDG